MTRRAALNSRIKAELRGFPRAQITEFVREVEQSLREYKTLEMVLKVEAGERAEVAALLEETQAYRKKLAQRALRASPFPRDIDSARDLAADAAMISDSNRLFSTRGKAVQALGDLWRELVLADQRLRKATPARTKADRHGLLSHLKREYARILGARPSSTSGGHFSNVVVIVLAELQGPDPKDVSRQVRAALKHR